VEILAGTIIRQISCGHSFTLALTTDGIIYSFGKNDKGQLGTGGGMMVDMYAMSSLPTVIEGHLENRNIVKVSAGHSHSACITDKGELFIWGMNLYLEPTLVTSITRVSLFRLHSISNQLSLIEYPLPLFSNYFSLSPLAPFDPFEYFFLVRRCRMWRELYHCTHRRWPYL
jgi:hypothetical protein